MNMEEPYWIALAHLPKWGYSKINNLIIKFFHEKKLSIEDFFQLKESDWENQFSLSIKDVEDLRAAKAELPNNAFIAESLLNEGYELIPITSPHYSKTLKGNLKAAHSPALLYIKGNKQIMQEKSVAIVGSRSASDISLQFTDNIAKLASRDYKVVVSGFAKGVDKQALDSAIKYKGHSIIVLPQGIMTFGSGYKNYYRQIVDGDVLVLSIFFPKAPWKVELAMARNPVIYGLADEIFVAESSEKGGTWSGVIDGLRKNRKIFVRSSDKTEKNANNLLIQKGAVAVDHEGNPMIGYKPEVSATVKSVTGEPEVEYEKKIIGLLKTGEYSIKDIIKKVQVPWTEIKIKDFLKNQNGIEKVNKRPVKYTLTNADIKQNSLF
jgi:predicted Rossmann fold nucleotide-binding protein DprA/Smf involved in DNA uptake